MAETYHEFTALVCFDSPEETTAVTEQLTPLGFNIETAKTTEEALAAFHTLLCDIIVTAENFGGSDAITNPVLAELNTLSQDARRAVFAIVIGQNRKTLSEMDAFCLSADLVLNPRDIPRLKALVGQGIARKEEFYRVFRTVGKLVEEEL